MPFDELFDNPDKSRLLAKFINSEVVRGLSADKLIQIKEDIVKPFMFWKGWEKELFKSFKEKATIEV